jgi:hypothetical protein
VSYYESTDKGHNQKAGEELPNHRAALNETNHETTNKIYKEENESEDEKEGCLYLVQQLKVMASEAASHAGMAI